MKPIACVSALLVSFAAREAVASCAAPEPYAFPARGQVLPNPTVYAEGVVRVTDSTGADLPFVEVPFGVRITAAPAVTFTLEAGGPLRVSTRRFGPYEVIAPSSSEVAPVEVSHVARFSHGPPESVRAAVLTVPMAADAYQLEVEELPSGALHTLVLPARRDQYWGGPPSQPAHLDLGFIGCRSNFKWVAPRVRVRVAALRTDGKRSAFSAPVEIRAPLPADSHLLVRLLDAAAENPAPFIAAVTVLVGAVGFFAVRRRRSLGKRA